MRKYLMMLLILTVAFIGACAYRRSVPEEQPTPTPTPATERPQGQGQQPVRDNLAKSEQEAVEENINGIEIDEDLAITRDAAERDVTQPEIGLSQQETVRIRQQVGPSPMNDVLQEYTTGVPDDIQLNIQYDQYQLSYDYFMINAEEAVTVRESPSPEAPAVREATANEKIALLRQVRGEPIGDSDVWYQISCRENGAIQTGFIHSGAGVPRSFRFEQMLQALRDLEQHAAGGALNYISNYKNVNGAPPTKGDEAVDEFGLRIYQSAPGYTEPNTDSDFRYIPDGILLQILDETEDFYRVNVLTFDGEHFVPKRYIERADALNRLSHIVVVDRSQQNQATFELGPNGVSLLSYTYSTTGFQGPFSFETFLGYYKAIEKKERFEYLENGTTEIKGYAPYAVRFCGGAYIHGVPVNYDIQDGERIDPGTVEYLQTIGTIPRSNMCVRNYTSHARFLYEWMEPEVGAILIIE